MNLWFRILYLLAASLFRPKLDIMDESVVSLRVWPTDLDVNIHMNNARYLAIMDLGRIDLILRTGLWRAFLRRSVRPVVASTVVRFRRPLRPFQRFRLHSRLVGWDERRFYMEHTLEAGGTVACDALVRGAFVRTSGGSIPMADMIESLGRHGEAPPLPAWVGNLGALDGALETR